MYHVLLELCPFLLSFTILVLSVASSTELLAVCEKKLIVFHDAETYSNKTSQVTLEGLDYPYGVTTDDAHEIVYISDFFNKTLAYVLLEDILANNTVVNNHAIEYSGVLNIGSIVYSNYDGALHYINTNHSVCTFNPMNSSNVCFSANIKRPRGIAVDQCNNILYWSEKGGNGTKSTIKSFYGNSSVVNACSEDNHYFQSISFDHMKKEMIVGITRGDDKRDSSCTILGLDVSTYGHNCSYQVLSTYLNETDGCFPSSITHDPNYIYWSDWNRQAIRRLSRHNSSDIIDLISCGIHGYRYYGPHELTVLGRDMKIYCNNRIEATDTLSTSGLQNIDIFQAVSKPSMPVLEGSLDIDMRQNATDSLLKINMKNIGTSETTTVGVNHLEFPLSINASLSEVAEGNEVTCHCNRSSISCILNNFTILFISLTLLFLLTTSVTLVLYLREAKLNKSVNYLPKVPKKFCGKPTYVNSGYRSSVVLEMEDCCNMNICDKPCSAQALIREGKCFLKMNGSDRMNLL